MTLFDATAPAGRAFPAPMLATDEHGAGVMIPDRPPQLHPLGWGLPDHDDIVRTIERPLVEGLGDRVAWCSLRTDAERLIRPTYDDPEPEPDCEQEAMW